LAARRVRHRARPVDGINHFEALVARRDTRWCGHSTHPRGPESYYLRLLFLVQKQGSTTPAFTAAPRISHPTAPAAPPTNAVRAAHEHRAEHVDEEAARLASPARAEPGSIVVHVVRGGIGGGV
jgi:hypothetical protein